MAATETSTRANAVLDDLYRHHVGEVYRYTYAVLGNHADAEDVTQTTFVNALRALERGESPQNASAWLIAIAHNVVRQRWRQAAARPAEVELVHDVPETPADEDIEVDELVRALQRIPPAQREALVMRELEGRSYNEIAGVLGLTTSALETLLFRARRSLAEELENLVTCQNAELAMSKQLDGRLGRKERRRLEEHLAECPDCARLAATQKRQRRAFKGLAVLPIPIGLALFKGAPSASAATSLPTIGLGATGTTSNGAVGATGVGVGGATSGGTVAGGSLVAAAAKVAAVIVAATVATGVAYKGVQLALGDSPSTRASASAPGERKAAAAPAARGAATATAAARPATPTSRPSTPTGTQRGTKAVAGGVAMESASPVVGHNAGGGPSSHGGSETGAAGGTPASAGSASQGDGSASQGGDTGIAAGGGTTASGGSGSHDGTGAVASGGTTSSAPQGSVSSGGALGASSTVSGTPTTKPKPKTTTPKPKKPKARNPKAAPKPKPAPPVGPGASNGNGAGSGPVNGNAGAGSGGAGQPSGVGQVDAGTGGSTPSSPSESPASPPSTGPSTGDTTAASGCPGGGNGPGGGQGCGVGNANGQDKAKP